MIHAVYLGDAVYAQINEATNSLVLTTGAHWDSGQSEMVIHLDTMVLLALKKYLERVERSTTYLRSS